MFVLKISSARTAAPFVDNTVVGEQSSVDHYQRAVRLQCTFYERGGLTKTKSIRGVGKWSNRQEQGQGDMGGLGMLSLAHIHRS